MVQVCGHKRLRARDGILRYSGRERGDAGLWYFGHCGFIVYCEFIAYCGFMLLRDYCYCGRELAIAELLLLRSAGVEKAGMRGATRNP